MPKSQNPNLTSSQRPAIREALDNIQKNTVFLRKNSNNVHDEKLKIIWDEVTALNRKLEQLQSTAGLTFYGFPNLPSELRRKIWVLAITSPQIIPVDYGSYCNGTARKPMAIIPTAPHSSLLRVNKESRSIAQKILLPYHEMVRGVPGVFTLLEIDTIWLVDPTEFEEEPQYADDTRAFRFEEGLRLLYKSPKTITPNRWLRKLAFSWNMFKEFANFEDGEFDFVMFIEDMVDAGVQEVYLVFDDNEAADKDDIVFVEPEKRPHLYLRGRDKKYLKYFKIGSNGGWDAFGKGMEKWIARFQDRHAEQPRAQRNSWDFVPSFKFVEAASASQGKVPHKRRRR